MFLNYLKCSCLLFLIQVTCAKDRTETGKQYQFYDDGPGEGYKPGPPPLQNGYQPGPPPSLNGYQPGPPPPPNLSSNGYHSGPPGPPPPPPFPEGYFGMNYLSPPGSLNYNYGSSPYYGNGHVYYGNYPPPPSPPKAENSVGGYMSGHISSPFGSYGGSSSASASSSASGSSSSASAAASNHIFGWGPYPPYPYPPPPETTTEPAPSPPPDDMFGWVPQPMPEYPPKPVPEFTSEFSLKPSAFGWETSYNVPCGNYKMQPRVIAHLRLATQAVLPKPKPKPETTEEEKRRKRSSPGTSPEFSFSHPSQRERSHHYSPYHEQQFSIPKPTFRPRTCRWNFNAVGGCKLSFKCGWFQLPALFRCDENFLHVTDNTILLDSKFCGNRRPRRIYTSSTGSLALTFKSEGAALPAIFDCTVICSPTDDFEPSPSPQPDDDFSPDLLHIRLPPPSKSPKVPDSAQGASTNTKAVTSAKGNSTVITNLPAKPQLRMGNCKCGVPDSHYSSKVVHGRIVGGSSMHPGESPWTAALVKRNSNRPYCGATLINNKFLLSAAHCVLNHSRRTKDSGGNKTVVERFFFDVLLNEHDISETNEIAGGTIRAKVDGVIVHPKYDNVTFDFDAALISLAQPVEFNSWEGSRPKSAKRSQNMRPFYYSAFDFHSFRRKRFIIPEIEARAIPPKPVPICLPDLDKNEKRNERSGKNSEGSGIDDFALVTGWGLVTEGGIPSNEMLKARVQIFNDTTCRDLYKKHNYVITDSMMCAGYINGNIDSCVGDSGSPLATEDKDRFVLTGIVSWGRGCGRKQLPGVYQKVSELMDWIYAKASSEDSVWCV